MRHGGFVRAHAFGIIEGLAEADAGQAYLQYVLEPALSAIAKKLKATPGAPQDKNALVSVAFAALSPMLVLSLHQDLLGGKTSDPINTGDVFRHLQDWLGKGLMA